MHGLTFEILGSSASCSIDPNTCQYRCGTALREHRRVLCLEMQHAGLPTVGYGRSGRVKAAHVTELTCSQRRQSIVEVRSLVSLLRCRWQASNSRVDQRHLPR